MFQLSHLQQIVSQKWRCPTNYRRAGGRGGFTCGPVPVHLGRTIGANDRPDGTSRRALPDLLHNFDSLCDVAFGVNLRDVGPSMSQNDLRGLQAELAANGRRPIVPQLVRRPVGNNSLFGRNVAFVIPGVSVGQFGGPFDGPAVAVFGVTGTGLAFGP